MISDDLARWAIRRWGEKAFLKHLVNGALLQELQQRGWHGTLTYKERKYDI